MLITSLEAAIEWINLSRSSSWLSCFTLRSADATLINRLITSRQCRVLSVSSFSKMSSNFAVLRSSASKTKIRKWRGLLAPTMTVSTIADFASDVCSTWEGGHQKAATRVTPHWLSKKDRNHCRQHQRLISKPPMKSYCPTRSYFKATFLKCGVLTWLLLARLFASARRVLDELLKYRVACCFFSNVLM